jgi:hypothetical protein
MPSSGKVDVRGDTLQSVEDVMVAVIAPDEGDLAV